MLRSRLPEEYQHLADGVRKIAEDRVGPLVRETERARTFSPEIRDILAEAGLLGAVVPERFGGGGGDVWPQVVIMEEMSRVYPSASTYLTAHWFASKLLAKHADSDIPDWQDDLLRRAADGSALGAIAATEPEAGSDLASLSTRARREGDGWVLSGQKRFITNGGHADFYTVLARSGGPGHAGISVFLVEADREGVDAARFEEKMGLHGSATAEMVFDDVLVPEDHLLGEEGRGFSDAMAGFDEGRIVVGALALGIAQGALDAAVRYADERHQFGSPIGSFQGVQFMLADMAIATATSRSIVYDAAAAYAAGDPEAATLAAIAKTHASDAAMQVTSDAVQVHGGYGYVSDFPVEMLMRDAKINQIYEGTNQIQRVLIARSMLGGDAD